MNKKKEEFGNDRLKNVIDEITSENPKEIIDKIFSSVKSFIGRAPQHDDMTLVVVKVN